MRQNYRLTRPIRLMAWALCVSTMLGCVSSPATHPGDSIAVSALSAEDQALLAHLSFAVKAGESTHSKSSSAYRVQDRATAGNHYFTGPFPTTPGQLPAGYSLRPAIGWLKVNPAITQANGNTTTESYYSPNGNTTSPTAYTRTVERDGTTLSQLYASPDVDATLPEFFQSRITSTTGTVKRAEETYSVFETTKTARGYRWSVRNANGLSAWIRAYQITEPNGTKIDKYEIFTNYQDVGGTPRPMRFAYGIYNETAGTGTEMVEDLDANGCQALGISAWRDLQNDKLVTYSQLVFGAGAVHKVLTYKPHAAETLTTVEDYQPDGSGTGTVTLNDVQRGTTAWDTTGFGTITLSSGTVAYKATRSGMPNYKPLCGDGGPLTSTLTTINGNFLDDVILPPNGPGVSVTVDGSF